MASPVSLEEQQAAGILVFLLTNIVSFHFVSCLLVFAE